MYPPRRGRTTPRPFRSPGLRPLLLGPALAAALSSSCGLPEPRNWPFPEVDAAVTAAARRGDAGPVVDVLGARVRGVESLYAELRMASEGGERSGVFDAVIHYAAPRRMRITGFRDLLISTRHVFDLALSDAEYVLRLDEDGEQKVRRGAVSELGDKGDGFEVFRLLGERIFLPGLVEPDEATRIELRAGELIVTVGTTSGEITWSLDPRTLGVRSAVARGSDGKVRAELEYPSFRRVHDVYLPERFTLFEASSGISISGWLRYVEVNPEVNDEVLDEPFAE